MTADATPVLRVARADDVPRLRALVVASARALSEGFYTPAQVEAALDHVLGVDTRLVADGTYYVIEAGGELAAAGGWSARRTLFGADAQAGRDATMLDPATEPARIRAFFVHPAWARRGLARRLFDACERAARDAGFRAFELMATLPGVPLYTALGFAAQEPVEVPLPGGLLLPGLRMTRPIAPDDDVAIAPLADRPQLVLPLAGLLHEEWRDFYAPRTADDVAEEYLRPALRRDRLPIALVALHGDAPVGTITLRGDSITTHPHLGPWLAAFLVRAEHRGRGVGLRLIAAAEAEARRLGIGRLYAGSGRAAPLFERAGWQVLERVPYHGEDLAILARDLE